MEDMDLSSVALLLGVAALVYLLATLIFPERF